MYQKFIKESGRTKHAVANAALLNTAIAIEVCDATGASSLCYSPAHKMYCC